jgi:hypothetical protein
MLSVVRQALRDDQIAALSDVGAGVPQTELAAESGASEATMRKRTQKSREKALGALKAKGYLVAGGFAALLAGVAVVLYVGPWREPVTVGHGRPAGDERKQLAAEQRRIAADWCKERNWDECEKALDRAARIDAEGDRAADVSPLGVMGWERATEAGHAGGPRRGRGSRARRTSHLGATAAAVSLRGPLWNPQRFRFERDTRGDDRDCRAPHAKTTAG